MNTNHVIGLIEEKPFGSLSEVELEIIATHTEACEDCLRAFQTARVSDALLKERAAAEFEPSPFFHTRVLAALRERQSTADAWGLGWLWRATGALASSMVVSVALLAALTFVIPESQQIGSASNSYSAEEVILNQTSQLEEQSDSQLLTIIYGGEEESSR